MKLKEFLRILVFAFIIKPFVFFILGIRIKGKENIPNNQFILISNHASHIDTLVLLSIFSIKRIQKIRPVAAADYWTKSKLIYIITDFLFNILPIPRKDITPSNNPLRIMESALKQGYSLIIYPEGTRSYGENIGPFKPGVAHLVKKNPEIPVIPVFIQNTARMLPKGQILMVPLFVDVIIGKPVVFSRETSKEEILDELYNSVKKLSTQNI
jgi:1-acyl-sn-glycerol-3-phosphate acyltransferase